MPQIRSDCRPSFALALAVAAAVALHGCGAGGSTDPQDPIHVGTWNILCDGCEWSDGGGTPIEIALCDGRRADCTAARFARTWEKIESLASSLDVLLLQEADASFMAAQSGSSAWQVASSAGMCVVLISIQSSFQVELNDTLALPEMSCGPRAPAVLVKRPSRGGFAALLSAHVKYSLAKDAVHAWYANATEELRRIIPMDVGVSQIIGGDFNNNLSEAQLPDFWTASAGNPGRGKLGDFTANHESGWLGDIDGFLATVSFQEHLVHLAGMMPKHVRGFVQGGVMQDWGRFKTNEARDVLSFSPSGADPWEAVPESNPSTQGMSDHLLVTAKFAMPDASGPFAVFQM